MCKNVIWCLIIAVLLIGCKGESKISESDSSLPGYENEAFKRAFSDGNYNFQVEYNNRLDTSYFDVLYKGKKVSRQGYKGKIEDEFITDLNRDNKNEVYIVVAFAEQTALFGYTFEAGKAVLIEKEEHRNRTNINSTAYKIGNNQIIETYISLSPSGQPIKEESRYNLVKRDNEYILMPEGWHPMDLNNMTGQYASRSAKGSGYYKVMFLKNKGGGKWNVDIKTKLNGSKKEICNFNGDGYFLDRDLIVPLNEVNPNLKGKLKIRFLDLMAIVYTEDQANSKEMISFCNGQGSIAGNFKKTDI